MYIYLLNNKNIVNYSSFFFISVYSFIFVQIAVFSTPRVKRTAHFKKGRVSTYGSLTN